MGLWVALSASVRDTVHTYRLPINRNKEIQPVPATANSLPYAVGRDKQILAYLPLPVQSIRIDYTATQGQTS